MGAPNGGLVSKPQRKKITIWLFVPGTPPAAGAPAAQGVPTTSTGSSAGPPPVPPRASRRAPSSPLVPQTNGTTAKFGAPATPLEEEDLSCSTEGTLVAAPVLDLSRVMFASGRSCGDLPRHELVVEPGFIAGKVSPRPGAEAWPKVLAAAEQKAVKVRAGASTAFHETEAKQRMTYDTLDRLKAENLLLEHTLQRQGRLGPRSTSVCTSAWMKDENRGGIRFWKTYPGKRPTMYGRSVDTP